MGSEMKQLNQYIQEKLKINSKSKISTNQWSIEDAKNGDFIHCLDTLLFIYYCLNTDKLFSLADEDAIVCHAVFFNDSRKKIEIGPDTGVGTIRSKYEYKLATEEEKEEFLKYLEKNGYEWDEKNLQVLQK